MINRLGWHASVGQKGIVTGHVRSGVGHICKCVWQYRMVYGGVGCTCGSWDAMSVAPALGRCAAAMLPLRN